MRIASAGRTAAQLHGKQSIVSAEMEWIRKHHPFGVVFLRIASAGRTAALLHGELSIVFAEME